MNLYVVQQYKGMNLTTMIININDHGYMYRRESNIYTILMDKYCFEYLVGRKLYISKFKPSKKIMEDYIKKYNVRLTQAFRGLTVLNEDISVLYDRGLPLLGFMANEFKTLYFNSSESAAIFLEGDTKTRFILDKKEFQNRSRILPDEGVIMRVKLKSADFDDFVVEAKEIHTTGHYFICKLLSKLDTGDYHETIVCFDMENCNYIVPFDVMLPIAIFFEQIGMSERELYLAMKSYDGCDNTRRLEFLAKSKDKEILYKDYESIDISFEVPESWNFTTPRKAPTPNKLKAKREKVKQWVPVHTRKIKGKASDDAKAIAKKFFINLEIGLTVVRPHTRRY